jgi:predicted chitinase
MAMLTEELLRKLCPKASDDFVKAFTSPEAGAIFTETGIDADPRIMAAFMANVCEETGGGTVVRESDKYQAKTLMKIFPTRYRVGAKVLKGVKGAYDPDGNGINDDADRDGISDLAEYHAAHRELIFDYNYGFRLGNEDDGTNDDDGYNYRGGGPLQATSKGFYKYLEKVTGIPFGSDPKQIENPKHWALVAAVTWTKHPSAGNLNPIALLGNFEACCRGINTGNPFSTGQVNGLPERIAWFKKWAAALGAKAPKSDVITYRYGSPKSKAVETMQVRLNALNYAEGKLDTDGVFGTRTRSAVMDFQLENGRSADGIVTPETMAAILASDAKPFPAPSYVALGVAGARKAGDPVVAQADKDKAAAVLLTTGAGASALNQAGMFDQLNALAKDAGTWQSSIQGLAGLLKFASTSALTIAAALAAYFLYRKYGAALAERFERWSRPVGTKGGS